MLLNGGNNFKLSATKSDVQAKHASFVKQVAQVTRIPEQPMLKFVEQVYDRHTEGFDRLSKWATDDFKLTSNLVSKVVGNQTGGAVVEQSIDLTKSEEKPNDG